MRKAIVTGANGFVGSYLVKELVDQGYDITAIVKDQHEKIESISDLPQVTIEYCELSELKTLAAKLPKEYEVFFHFAWAGTSGDIRADYEVQLNNAKYTCDAILQAKELACRRFVFAGSVMEYEAMQYIGRDNAKPGLGYIYSIAKQTADYMAKTLALNTGVDYINVIISNIYGKGELSQRFINTTLKKFIHRQKSPFTSGEQLYDFIYVTDAVKAIRLAAEQGKAYSSYYIGNEKPQKLKDFIIKMRDAADSSIELEFGLIPSHGALLEYTEFDTMKLKREFDFVPEISFESGIRMTLEWIKSLEGFNS